jgi:hypothetical protein
MLGAFVIIDVKPKNIDWGTWQKKDASGGT